MKKLLFAMVVSALLIFAVATVASADNGPHGGFNGSTDACASCHRAHSAISSDGFLLVAADVYSLCTSCHDGTGAYTNVVDGYFDTSAGDPGKNAFNTSGQGDAGHGLFAGGFVNARMLTDYGNASNEGGLANATTNAAADQNASLNSWARRNAYDAGTGIPSSRAVTSNHDVSTIGRAGTVWGSGNINGAGTLANNWGAGSFTGATELECTSCHDPHGNAGRQGGLSTGAPYPSYRILRFEPEGSNGFEVTNASLANTVGSGTTFTWNTAVVPDTLGVLVPDPAVSWYTPNTDYTQDGMLLALRGRTGSGEIFVANFAGVGDYMGRYYGYQRPAGAVTASVSGTILSCLNGSGVPTVPGTACGATSGPAFNNVAAQDKLGYWCATCHDRYLAQGGTTRTTDSGDPGYHFRHRSQGNGATAGQYTCVSCHNAHGTAATASSTLADSASYATGSVLLKADNRAICIRCHAGAINFFNVTTSPAAPMVLP